jgi:hypothetical protein
MTLFETILSDKPNVCVLLTCLSLCIAVVLLVTAILKTIASWLGLEWMKSSLDYKVQLQAKVIEKEQADMLHNLEEDGGGSFSFNDGAFKQYTLWIEFLDFRRVYNLGLKPICEFTGIAYRKEWNNIPKNCLATVTLKKMVERKNGHSTVNQDDEYEKHEEWTLEWVELERDKDTGSFIVSS